MVNQEMQFKPIFLAATGRSGSTLMMKILSLHQQVLARSIFPYETRAFQYYYLSFHQDQIHPTFKPLKLEGAEYLPFQGNDKPSKVWSQEHQEIEVRENGQNVADEYYRFIAKIENKLQAQYFIEKSIGLPLIEPITQSIKTSKVIFVNRDPRDTFFSIKSFNKRRGFLTFGEEHGDETMFSRLVYYYEKAGKLAEQLGDRAVTIFYENLILNKFNTLLKLFQDLELNSSNDQIDRIINSAFSRDENSIEHQTTKNEKSSLSRWKYESNAENLALFDKYKINLNQIGYF